MELRMYCIVNQYISGIHAGIQSAHAIAELMNYYGVQNRGGTNARVLTQQWAEEFKTVIVLDGGYQSNLQRILVQAAAVPSLPRASFREEQDALNGAMTAICMVLPKYMYDPQYSGAADLVYRPGQISRPEIANKYIDPVTLEVLHNYTGPEKELITSIKSLRLKGA